MASQRITTLRLQKANLIAQMELQRAEIAQSWAQVSQPLQPLERGIQTAARHPWLFGGIGAAGALAFLVPGKFWLVRKSLRLASIAIPLIMGLRKTTIPGLLFSFLKKRFLSTRS